jgi:hypothetical protein
MMNTHGAVQAGAGGIIDRPPAGAVMYAILLENKKRANSLQIQVANGFLMANSSVLDNFAVAVAAPHVRISMRINGFPVHGTNVIILKQHLKHLHTVEAC